MYSKRKLKPRFAIILVILTAGLFVAGVTFADYDYYDPYSNSNIDYFPSNPVYTSPKKTDSSTSGGSTSGGTSGGTTSNDSPVTPPQIPSAVVPENKTAVNLNSVTGEVFNAKTGALITDARYHKASRQILYRDTWRIFGKVLTDTTGYVDIDPRGSVETVPSTSPPTQPLSTAQDTESAVVPENSTAVTLDPATGEVFSAKTGLLIHDARYDVVARKIYYKNTNSTFGKVITDTTGYVNIDLRGLDNASPLVSVSDGDEDSGITPDTTLKKTLPPSSSDISGDDFDAGERADIGTDDSGLGFLDVDFDEDELEKFRADVSTLDPAKIVIVRGWDPEKKGEIVGRPEMVSTHRDLKIYVEAVALSDAAIKGISINDSVLELVSREKGKLFWFIPVEFSSRVVVNFDPKDGSDDLASVRLPWWHVFIKKSFSPSMLEKSLQAEFSGAFDPTTGEKVNNVNSPIDVSRIARALGRISTIMKTGRGM